MRSTKPSSSCSTSFSSSTWKTGGEDAALAVRVATGRGSVRGGYLGRGITCGTMNPSYATLILWSQGSLALITHDGAWNTRDMGL